MTICGPFSPLWPVARGGMGSVWRGEHAATGQPVAIKIVADPDRLPKGWERQFRREIQAVAALDHPHTILVFDHGTTGAGHEEIPAGLPYLVMEWAGAGTLASAPLPDSFEQARGMFLAILHALGHAHARGLLHRDLKPENVLVCGADDLRPGIKLADFGLAMDTMSEAVDMVRSGTPRFMAPEQIQGHWRDYGPATDLYALGGMAWWWICGVPAFSAKRPIALMAAHLHSQPEPWSPRFAVPDGVEDWVRCLLAKSPSERFSSAAMASAALLALGDAPHSVAPATPASIPESDRTWVWQEPLTAPTIRFEATSYPRGGVPTPALATGPHPSPPLPSEWRVEVRARDLRHLHGAGQSLTPHRILPIVGREVLQDHLWATLNALASGQPTAVLLTGRPGVGTTRLARWLGEALASTTGVHPWFVEPRRGVAGAIEDRWRSWGLTGDDLATRVASVLEQQRLPIADLAPSIFAALDRGANPVSALARVFARTADADPQARQLCILDEVDRFADAEHILSSVLSLAALRPMPVMVLMTAHEAPDWAVASSDVHVIHVPELSPQACVALATEMLGLAPTLAAQLAEACGGNPSLAQGIVQRLINRGELHLGDLGFELNEGAELDPPEDQAAVLQARLHDLFADPLAGEIVALEAVAALDAQATEQAWGQVCVQLGVPWGRAVLAQWIGAGVVSLQPSGHIRINDAAMRRVIERGSGLAGRWTTVCRAIVDTVEQPWGTVLRDAGEAEAACEALMNEGAILTQQRRLGEAVARYDAAIQSASDAGLLADPHTELDLRLRRINLYGEISDSTGGMRESARCVELAEQFGTPAQLGRSLLHHGSHCRWAGFRERGRALTVRAAKVVEGQSDEACQRLLPMIYLNLASAELQALHLPEAEAMVHRALECATGAVVPRVQQRAWGILADIYRHLGRTERAMELIQQTLETDGAPAYLVRINRINLGLVYIARQDWRPARDLLAQAKTQAEEELDAHLNVMAASGLLRVQTALGEWEAATQSWAQIHRLIGVTRTYQVDMALLLEDAGKAAEQSHQSKLAQSILDGARAQWVAMNRADRAAVVAR